MYCRCLRFVASASTTRYRAALVNNQLSHTIQQQTRHITSNIICTVHQSLRRDQLLAMRTANSCFVLVRNCHDDNGKYYQSPGGVLIDDISEYTRPYSVSNPIIKPHGRPKSRTKRNATKGDNNLSAQNRHDEREFKFDESDRKRTTRNHRMNAKPQHGRSKQKAFKFDGDDAVYDYNHDLHSSSNNSPKESSTENQTYTAHRLDFNGNSTGVGRRKLDFNADNDSRSNMAHTKFSSNTESDVGPDLMLHEDDDFRYTKRSNKPHMGNRRKLVHPDAHHKHHHHNWTESDVGPDLMSHEDDDYRYNKPHMGNRRKLVHPDAHHKHHRHNWTYKQYSVSNYQPSLKGEASFGHFPVLLALQAARRPIHKVYIKEDLLESEKPVIQQIIALAKERQIEISACNRRELDNLSGDRPNQGVVIDAGELEMRTVDDLADLSVVSHDGRPRVCLILDSIQDPMNLGAVIRSSYYLGVNKLMVTIPNSCSLTPIVSKASSGAMEIMPVYGIRHVHKFLEEKRAGGWKVYGTACHEVTEGGDGNSCPSLALHSVAVTSDTIILMGNEGVGLSEQLLSQCDATIYIDPRENINPAIDSLNVSVATGIILQHLLSSSLSSVESPSTSTGEQQS